MADFLSTLQQFESGGRNIPNTTQGTSSGQAQGYNQITTGTWKEFGGLDYAPTPLQATQEQQNAIAAKIPLKRWAPETLAYLRNNGFTLNPDATLADNIALNHGAAGVAPPPHSTTPTQAPGPMDPSAQAGGPGAPLGTPGSTVNPPIPTIPGMTINSNPVAGGLGGQIGQLAQNLKKTLQPDADQKPPDIKPNIPPAPGARNVSFLLGGPGGIGQGQVSPLYAQRMAALNPPMTWGGAPPGQMAGTGYGMQAQPSVYGTSLMSNLQQLSDPMWMSSWDQ